MTGPEKLRQMVKVYQERPMNKEMEAQVRVIVKDEAKRIVDENTQLKILLARILNDLPTRRDWLDPDLEREARELLKRYA